MGEINLELINKDDLVDHTVVCGVITKDSGILIEYHNKYNFLTIPGGKVNEGECLSDAFIREMKEELGITINDEDFELLIEFVIRRNVLGNDIVVTNYIYIVHSYTGEITNIEPTKHNYLKFIDISELNSTSDELSDVTEVAIDQLDIINYFRKGI